MKYTTHTTVNVRSLYYDIFPLLYRKQREAIKTQGIRSVSDSGQYKPGHEVSGGQTSVRSSLRGHGWGPSSLKSGWHWLGRECSQGGWGILWFIAFCCSPLTAASIAKAPMEPLGETKAALPLNNPHGRAVVEVPHLTPQKQGNEGFL